MSVTTRLGTLISNVGHNTKWIKYTSNSKAYSKWGLREVIKEYKPNGDLSNMTYIFSTNPILGYQKVSAPSDKMRKLWASISNLDNKESVSDLLNFLRVFKINW